MTDVRSSKTSICEEIAARLRIINGMFPTKDALAMEIVRLERDLDGLAKLVLSDAPLAEHRVQIKRLREALTWCLKDSYWLHRENAFESDEPKPAGVLETLEEVRRELYPAIAEVSSG